MAVVINELTFYTNLVPNLPRDKPWTDYLNTLPLNWTELNYWNYEGAEATIQALNTWDLSSPLTMDDYPFVLYKKYETNKPPKIIVHKTIEDLKADTDLLNV